MADEHDQIHDLNALLGQCRRGDRLTRIRAMMALEKAGAEEAVPVIVPLLKSEDEGVRAAAADALGALGDGYLHLVGPALEGCFGDPAWLVRNAAVEALGLLRCTSSRPALERVLRSDPQWEVRASAAEALGEVGDPQALDALVAALDDESHPVRAYAAFAIGQLGDASHLPAIRRRLAVEEHPMPRADLLDVALRWGDESAFDDVLALIRAANDEEFAHDVLRLVSHLLSEQVPAVVLKRAAELDRHLAELAQQTGIEADSPDRLRTRLAARAQPIATNEE